MWISSLAQELLFKTVKVLVLLWLFTFYSPCGHLFLILFYWMIGTTANAFLNGIVYWLNIRYMFCKCSTKFLIKHLFLSKAFAIVPVPILLKNQFITKLCQTSGENILSASFQKLWLPASSQQPHVPLGPVVLLSRILSNSCPFLINWCLLSRWFKEVKIACASSPYRRMFSIYFYP